MKAITKALAGVLAAAVLISALPSCAAAQKQIRIDGDRLLWAGSFRFGGPVASLPAAPVAGDAYIVTNAAAVDSCEGTGAYEVLCIYDGAAWSAVNSADPESGIENGDYLVVDDSDAADGDVAMFTASGIEGVATVPAANLPTVSDSSAGVVPSTADRSTDDILHVQSDGSTAWHGADNIGLEKHMVVLRSTSAQSIANTTATKLTFTTEDYDIGGLGDYTTNERADIQRDGKYLLKGKVCIAVDDGEYVSAVLKKNGTDIPSSSSIVLSSAADTVICATPEIVADLDASDYIELYVTHNEGASQDTQTTDSQETILSVTQLDAAFSGKIARPMAKITRWAAQSIPTATKTKIAFNAIEYDNFGMADITTNDRIDIPRDGKYLINYMVGIGQLDDGEYIASQVTKNGDDIVDCLDTQSSPSSGYYLIGQGTCNIELDAGDYIELYVTHSEGASQDGYGFLAVTQLDSDFTGDQGKHAAQMIRSATQSIPHNTYTKIAFDTVVYDIGGIADCTTNDRFDIARSGLYLIHAYLLLPQIDSGEAVVPSILVNGTAMAVGGAQVAQTNQNALAHVVYIAQLNAGDYIEMGGYHNEGAAIDTLTTIDAVPRMSVTQIDGVDYGDRGPTTVACDDADDTCAYTEGFSSYYLTSGDDSTTDRMTISDGQFGQWTLFYMQTDGGDDISVEFTNGLADCDDFTAAGQWCLAEFDGSNFFVRGQSSDSVPTAGIANTNNVVIDDTDAADGDFGILTASGLEGVAPSAALGLLSGQAGAAFSFNAQNITAGYVGATGKVTITDDGPFIDFIPDTAGETNWRMGVGHDSDGNNDDAIKFTVVGSPSVVMHTFNSDGSVEHFGSLSGSSGSFVNTVRGGTVSAGETIFTADITHGGSHYKVYAASSGTLAGATDTIELAVPSGWRILQCQLHVKTAVTDDGGDDTWSAELYDGAIVESIVAGAAAAQDTDVDHWADADTTWTLTDAETDILLTPNGGDFSAGEIEAWCLAVGFAAWDSEP